MVERRRGPVDKACGEGLMPHALRQLRGLGADPPGMPFHGITYLDGRRRVTGRFRAGPGRGVRRTVCTPALLDAATAAGVQHRARRGRPVDARTRRRCAAATSAPATWPPPTGCTRRSAPRSGWPARRRARGGGASAVIISMTPWSDCVEVHWSGGAEAYVTPVADDCVGVAILTSHRARFDEHLEAFPASAGSVAAVTTTSRTGRQARCGRGCAAGRRAGCCWSVTRPDTSTR